MKLIPPVFLLSLAAGSFADVELKKADLGALLALWALANDYGQRDLVVSGPTFRDLKIKEGKVRLFFNSLGGGLMVVKKEGRDLPLNTQTPSSVGFPSPARTTDGRGLTPLSTTTQSSSPHPPSRRPWLCAMPMQAILRAHISIIALACPHPHFLPAIQLRIG